MKWAVRLMKKFRDRLLPDKLQDNLFVCKETMRHFLITNSGLILIKSCKRKIQTQFNKCNWGIADADFFRIYFEVV